MNKSIMSYSYDGLSYSNENENFTTIQNINLANNILSERNQIHKNIYHMIPGIYL